MRMREFARRNAGVAAAVGVYGMLAVGGVLVVQQMARPVSPPVAVLPPSSPSQPAVPSPSTRPVAPSPTPTAGTSRTLIAAEPVGRETASGQRQPSSGRPPRGRTSFKPSQKPTTSPTPPPTTQPPQSSRCSSGRVVAVQLPLGVLQCDTVRVGSAVTIGGTKK